VIEVVDLHKTYDRTVAVAGLSFSVTAGQILGLIGPNGAGKTTTMRALAGIIPPTRGRLLIAGHDIAAEPVAAKSRLAYVPDDPKLFDALTVAEHLEFTAAAYRVADYADKAARLVDQFQLTEHRLKLGQELSRGMRQKLAVCCAYLHDPAAILLDEPLTGLDPRSIRTMHDSIRDRAKQGAAIVISSHLLAMVEDLCTQILILHRGQRLFLGPIAEARGAFAGDGSNVSLEEVFLRATEEQTAGQDSPPLGSPSGDA
jgi:ABC-2 type transport system ATP-binding protein